MPALLTRMSSGPTAASASVDELLERSVVREIPSQRMTAAPEVGNRLDVDSRDDAAPSATKPLDDRPPDAVRAAGDERRRRSSSSVIPRSLSRLVSMLSGPCDRIAPTRCDSASVDGACCRATARESTMKITDVEPIVLRLAAGRHDAGGRDAGRVPRPRPYRRGHRRASARPTRRPYLARTIVEMPSSHSIARGLREVLVGEDPLQIDRLWQLMFHASDHYGRGGAALHVDQRDRHRALGHRGQGRRAARSPICSAARRIADDPRLRERGDAGDSRRGAADRRARRRRRVRRAQARLGAARPRPRVRRGARRMRRARRSARTAL